MAATVTPLLQYLRRLAAAPESASDAALLARFVRRRDEAAFAALVARHGPMVLNVCRRVLGDVHAAEDAFQATFLVLARRAGALARPEAVAGWLYGVAGRVAHKARRAGMRRQGNVELAAAESVDPTGDPLAAASVRELLAILEDEVRRLPAVYRLPVALCCLEGLSQEEAARRLGWSAGSVKGRLERGRKQLHGRLAKRGLTLTAALAAAEVARGATAQVPAALAQAAVRIAVVGVAEQGTGAIPVGVAVLTKGAVEAMRTNKLKIAVALVLAVGILGAGLVLLSNPTPAIEPNAAPQAQPDKTGPQTKQPAPVAPAKTDKELLQGKWQLVKVNAEGKHLAHHIQDKQLWVIAGDRITIHYGDGGEQEDFVFKLDPTQKPRAIDMQLIQGQLETVIYQGIYELNGDELKLCRGMTRPTHFKIGEEDRGKILFVLKRVKQAPEKDEPNKMTATKWSKTVKGLQGRLVYEGIWKPDSRDIIQIALELKNDSSSALAVLNDPDGLKWEVRDAQGKPVGKASYIIDGPIHLPAWVTLPPYTYLGFSVYDHRITVGGKGTLLAVQPDGHVWLLQPGEYTLHATFTAAKHKDAPKGAWSGQLELPPLKIVVK